MKKSWVILIFAIMTYFVYSFFAKSYHETSKISVGHYSASSGKEVDPSWLANAQAAIAASEYHIQWRGNLGAYQSYNRAQNMRFTYYDNGFKITPGSDSTGTWDIELRLTGISKGSEILEILKEPGRMFQSDTMLVDHRDFKIQFINNEQGMRQNFIVNKKPVGDGFLKVVLAYKGSLSANFGKSY